MRLSVGSSVGPYEISAAIGAGGMGEVYRARDTRLGRDVALKVLPREVIGDADRLARFEREARSSSALNHPNIVTIHDFSKTDADCYLVMELVQGESLRDLIRRGPVPLKKLMAIAGGIADGLAAAHTAGIIHRDLKPENVMVTPEGQPKVLDFGLARATMKGSAAESPTELRLTGSGVILGTVTYMSPEQASDMPVDIQSDQFSFGLILHEMTTGVHPFRRSNSFETVTAILREEPPPLGPSFPAPFVWIVERCLSKEPSGRYASTTDLAHDVAALRERSGILHSGTHAAETLALIPASRPLRLSIAGLMVLLLAVMGWSMVSRRASGGLSEPLHVHIATPGLELHRGETALPVAISPDGHYLAIYGTGETGTAELWLTDLRSGERRLIAQHAFAVSWSSDAASVAFFQDGKLKTVRVDGGPATVVCDARAEGTPSWHGDTILFMQVLAGPGEAGIYRVAAAGGVPEKMIGASASPTRFAVPWWPQFLPDGKRFVYLELISTPGPNRIDHQLMLGSLDGSAPRAIGAIDSRAIFADGHLLYVRDGTLLAQPFDPDSARFTGQAKPLLDDLRYFRSTGMAAFSVSHNGILAWGAARPPSRLVWMNRSGMETQAIATAHFDVHGRLSADGSLYAVGVVDPQQGIADIWTYDLARESAERLTSDLLDQRVPVWAHDGRTIYYRTDGQGGPPDIMALHPGEAGSTMLHRGPGVEHPEDVSPDGSWLLFTRFAPTNSDIYALPLDPPGAPEPFVATRFNESSPRFSPDGQWVAYAANLSGRAEIYVRLFAESAPATRVSREGGTMPRWSRDGRELFFLGPDGRLMTVPFDGSFGAPRMLFQARAVVSFEPGTDSDRFLVQLEERSGEASIHLLINWRARLDKP